MSEQSRNAEVPTEQEVYAVLGLNQTEAPRSETRQDERGYSNAPSQPQVSKIWVVGSFTLALTGLMVLGALIPVEETIATPCFSFLFVLGMVAFMVEFARSHG